MHINSDQLGKELDYEQQEHLSACPQCLIEHETMRTLFQQAEEQILIEAPKEAWQNIAVRRENIKVVKLEQRARFSPFRWPVGVAASAFFLSVSWLMWSNHQLQTQLEQVLAVNQTLEIQLMQGSTPTFYQTQLLSKIRWIELQLAEANTPKEKILLLKQRQKIMAEMVEHKQGKSYEYSI